MPKGPIDWDELEDDSSETFEKSAWKSSRRRRPRLPRDGGPREDGRPEREEKEPEAEGEVDETPYLVISVGAKRCIVQKGAEDLHCRLPSDLAARQRSRLAVGDRVVIEKRRNGWWVRQVLERRSALSRPDPRDPRREKVIAANVDLVVIVAAVQKPGVRTGLIDRYLLAVQRGGAEAAVCINKVDLAEGAEDAELKAAEPYRELGLPVVFTAAKEGRGLDELRQVLRGKLCVFVGHSGVGKSSLMNALVPELDLDTAAVSDRDGTGRHTTTRSNLFDLGGGTRIIDTPGIREFGLWDLEPEEVKSYFPEFLEPSAGCRFKDCSHTHEPECAVKSAVAAGEIPRARYDAYLRILESLQT